MRVTPTAIPDVLLIEPTKHGDHRGFFSEVFRVDALERFGIAGPWLQDNHSFSAEVGTVRGLHFQVNPRPQGKLMRVTRGAILDVAVDLRQGSPTFGQHVAVELSAERWNQLWVPVGFAHGFCTLTPDVEVLYKVTGYYDAACDRGLRWDDPALGIAWPVSREAAQLSAKDRALPSLADLPVCFTYGA